MASPSHELAPPQLPLPHAEQEGSGQDEDAAAAAAAEKLGGAHGYSPPQGSVSCGDAAAAEEGGSFPDCAPALDAGGDVEGGGEELSTEIVRLPALRGGAVEAGGGRDESTVERSEVPDSEADLELDLSEGGGEAVEGSGGGGEGGRFLPQEVEGEGTRGSEGQEGEILQGTGAVGGYSGRMGDGQAHSAGELQAVECESSTPHHRYGQSGPEITSDVNPETCGIQRLMDGVQSSQMTAVDEVGAVPMKVAQSPAAEEPQVSSPSTNPIATVESPAAEDTKSVFQPLRSHHSEGSHKPTKEPQTAPPRDHVYHTPSKILDASSSPPSHPTSNPPRASLHAAPSPVSLSSTPNKDVVMAELKAMKIASLQARNASLEAEIASKLAKLEQVTSELSHRPAAETVRTHIRLLHEYNDIRDVGQGLLGMVAENRGGGRVGELYGEFGVGLQD